jgi:predicted nucleic acid-binding Zn ribbon protein
MERHCFQCGTPFVTTNPRRKYCSPRCRSHAFAARERTLRTVLQMESGERRAA